MVNKSDIEFIKSEYQKIQNLYIKGDYNKVIEKTKIILRKDSSQTTFYNLIGLSYLQLEKFEMAEKILKSGLKVNSKSTSILCNLGTIYRNWGKLDEAEKNFKRVLDINPKDVNALVNYANLKRDLNKIEESLELYNEAFKINNNNETLLINYAGAYQIAGKFEMSKKILESLHEKYPNNIIAHKMYSSINFYKENDKHQKIMIEKVSDQNLSPDEKTTLFFSIAKSFSDQKNPAKSSEYFIKANKTKFLSFKEYDFNSEKKLFNKIKEIFSDYKFISDDYKKNPDLIFIVGLPRSGTTLIHQIVSSHSKVFGAGELSILRSSFLNKLNELDFLKKILGNNASDILFKKEIANIIFNKFKYYDKKSIILDKAPLNFLWIGFIKILFPNSKIIHSKRNLKDTTLSIYRNVFDAASLAWTYDQDCLIQFVKYYKDLMNFWQNKIPNFIYECEYENLVNNKNLETQNLIKFCNLDWEDKCIDHTQNNTGIKTISIAQARKPIYKTSVNLNETYSKYLEFLNQIEG